MGQPKQDAAVAWLKSLQGQLAQLRAVKYHIDQLLAENTEQNYVDWFRAQDTYPVNADGTVSDTKDAARDDANAIIVGGVDVSWNAINGGLIVAADLQASINGEAANTVVREKLISSLLAGG